jgi:hypothetical protein
MLALVRITAVAIVLAVIVAIGGYSHQKANEGPRIRNPPPTPHLVQPYNQNGRAAKAVSMSGIGLTRPEGFQNSGSAWKTHHSRA